MRSNTQKLFKDESGQLFIGYIIAVLLIASMMAYVMRGLRDTRKSADQASYQQYALAVARMGFEDALSFFRRQPDGVSMAGGYPAYSPSTQDSVLPWPMHPDAAFNPQSTDTDHYNFISMAANATDLTAGAAALAPVATARGIVRTFPLLAISSLTITTKNEVNVSPLWGRWVIRRQNLRNWSPGPNTMMAYTDPEAAHDITHLRTQAAPGSGNYWSITSRGYVMRAPAGVTLTTGFENAAMFEGGNFMSAPKRTYLNKPLLLATAKVYGEFFRINFNDQASAIWASVGGTVTANTNGIISGGVGKAVASNGGAAVNTNGSPSVTGGYVDCHLAPAVSNVFPGLDKAKLQSMIINHDVFGYIGGVGIFPKADQVDLTTVASRNTFYYLGTSATSGTAIFPAGATARVMTGVGLVFVDGNLQMDAGGLSTWSGIIFVNGNVTLRGPVELSGTLIATGYVNVGNSADINKASVEYNPNAITSVKSFLQGFTVLKNSVVATTY